MGAKQSKEQEDVRMEPVHAPTAPSSPPQTPLARVPRFSEQIESTAPSSAGRPDAITPTPIRIHELEGHSNVTRPPAPPRMRTLSELIDPADFPEGGHVRSPSGNLLGQEEYLAHPNRPRSIRERQEAIRERVKAASRLGVELETARRGQESSKKGAKKGRRTWCNCFGG